jgi:hypothetical protein
MINSYLGMAFGRPADQTAARVQRSRVLACASRCAKRQASEIGMNPRQIENRSNLANWVIVRNCLIKMERIKQLLLVVIEPPHHRSPPQRIA